MALLVTQCPRCESTFNTSARVLDIAHGLVRCGACLSVFEADQHLIDPLPDRSSDEDGVSATESVFISAPQEYFNPAQFLYHGVQDDEVGNDEDEDEGEDVTQEISIDKQDHDFDSHPGGGAISSYRDEEDDAVVILPEGPDAAALLEELRHNNDSDLILPPDPDTAAQLDELMALNDQQEDEQSQQEPESIDLDIDTDELSFLPEADWSVADAPGIGESAEFEDRVSEFSDALDDVSGWDGVTMEVDESSFVILPPDPYQPSAFRDAAGEQSGGPYAASGDILSSTATANLASDPAAEIPALTTPAADEIAAVRPDSTTNETEAGEKNAIRTQVMAAQFEEQENLPEQLSEENLRAVRDVDTVLELEQKDPTDSSRAVTLAVIALLLTLIASGVFFWIRMPQLSQDPRFRNHYEMVCNLLGCRLPDYLNPARVEISNLVVRSHPQLENSLELTAVFRNAAQFPQPFPTIELTFSDLSNRSLMIFEFLPDEYLPQALRGTQLMPVDAPVQITLDLADPGSNAVNYQMTFKAAPPRPR